MSIYSAKRLYRAAAEPSKAGQLCVFILGTRYLYSGVLKSLFGYGCAVCVNAFVKFEEISLPVLNVQTYNAARTMTPV